MHGADRKLAQGVIAGDARAAATFTHQCQREVFNLFMWLTRDPELAEDLTQDTIVRCWERLPQYRGEAGLRTWVHKVALSLLAAQKRRNAQESLEMATRDGREVALVTVSYTTDAGGVPVHVREVFEVDAETDHLLSTRKFSRTGDGAEELVGAVDRVDYNVPLPAAAGISGIPGGTATVQATAAIEETASSLALVMKVDGVELGRMDVLRAE